VDRGRLLLQTRRAAEALGASLADFTVFVFSTRGVRGLVFGATRLASDLLLRHVPARGVRRGPFRAPWSAYE